MGHQLLHRAQAIALTVLLAPGVSGSTASLSLDLLVIPDLLPKSYDRTAGLNVA